MDSGIWAVWYDLPEAEREDHLDWLHEVHLPWLVQRPGFAWAASYRHAGGGDSMDAIHDRLSRPEEEVPRGVEHLVLIGAPSPHVFFAPRLDALEAGLEGEARVRLDQRERVRIGAFTEEARVTGPAYGERVPGATPGPAIQLGSFRVRSLAEEFDLAAWYAQYRLPHMSRMAGSLATRKLVAVAGWARHAILYEFSSLEARAEHFQGHESLALDETVWTNRIITYTVHAPGSPWIGERLWPAVADTPGAP